MVRPKWRRVVATDSAARASREGGDIGSRRARNLARSGESGAPESMASRVSRKDIGREDSAVVPGGKR
jgi:hypothetical protein